MLLTDPHWLILLMPLAWLVWHFRPLSRRLLYLRSLLVILVILALAGLQLSLPGREGAVVVVADRSHSMPVGADLRVGEMMGLLKNQMPPGARLGLVSFGEEARVEMAPARSAFTGFAAEINPEASRLDEGLKRALSLIPGDLTARIIVVSDGLWSGIDPRTAAFLAAGRNIPIDYRLVSRDLSGDLAITSFQVPGLLNPGEAFLAAAEVFSPVEQLVEVGLFSSDKLIASFTRQMKSGENSLMFSLSAPPASVVRFRLEVSGSGDDPMPENNRARAISEVVGQKPVLVISDDPGSSLFTLLRQAGTSAELADPVNIVWSMEFLAGYSAVVIENVPANRITMHGMQLLAAWVNHIGGGLLLTGGKNSYGNGGYYQSPLEAVLPVSLELRSQHRKLALALMVVLDRSGSMAAPARGDRTKMDLANIAAASSLDLLSPLDEFGLLAVDTEAHVVVPLQRMTEKARWRNLMLRVESSGGGIYVYEGISKAAEMLLKAEAQTRHIILFADATDSEQPGRYWELLDKATKAGLTLSVIGLGTEGDSDANLLKKIADAGKGRIFFTRDPEELPRLFSQDTFVAARSTFIDEPSGIESLSPVSRFVDGDRAVKSRIGAYNLCYLRPEAFMALRTTDENSAPLLAAWQSGLGRVACYAGVTSGEGAGAFLTEPAAADILNGVCRWVSLDDRQSVGEMTISQQISNGRWRATLFLDPEREREFFRDNPEIQLIRASEGREPETTTMQFHWDSADSLVAETMVRGNEVLAGVLRSGKLHKRLNPVCQPYGPEFAPARDRDGAAELKDIAAVTGGHEIIDLGQVWNSMPSKIQLRSLSGELLFLALLVFLIEVADCRTAFLSIIIAGLRRKRQLPVSAEPVPVPAAAPATAGEAGATVSTTGAAGSVSPGKQETSITDGQKQAIAGAAVVQPPTSADASEEGFSSALKTAKKHAGKHTRS